MRVLIAEDHDLVREGIAALIDDRPRIEVVGQAADGEEAVALTQSLRPDVVLMDLAMPALDGVEATRVIKKRCPRVRILALTVADDERRVAHALHAGVDGYALKRAGRAELLAALAAVVAGRRYLGAGIDRQKVEQFLRSGEGKDPLQVLTGRERQILGLVVAGRTSADIARTLAISPKTVETHRTSIMRKLNLPNSVALAGYALRHGLVADDGSGA